MACCQPSVNIWKYGFFACLLYILFDSFGPSESRSSAETPGETATLGVTTYVAEFPLQEPPSEAPLFESLPRQLSQSAGSSATSAHSPSSDHGKNGHPHDALFFFFNALIVGTVILHVTMLPRFKCVQQTVCLFILGIVYSLIQEGLQLKTEIGVFGISYDMWMAIDPHLLLFSMLPALLAGDAMTINTQIARSVAQQCIFLAGPGVLLGSFLIAGFLYNFVPDWSFMLCLTAGSILSATDPVAVVSLLKELGTSPTLTSQIQGESLLNDGTAIVLYTITYDIVSGKVYDGNDIMIFLVLIAGCAVGLGLCIGLFFLQWIKLASVRVNRHAGLIQTSLTLCCAYWSFCIAEGALHISGVLCTVTASLVLADTMWPFIVDSHSLLHIWHMFEYLGNTIVFFLAGALTGNTMVHIAFIDYMRVIVIYIVCMLIRAFIIFGCRPILSHLSKEQEAVTMADAAVMTWGGLRGAVGLALAIQVSLNRADGRISELDGRRMLFYVAGVATLTLCINATTCPMLVRGLGLSRTSKAKQKMLGKIYEQLAPMVSLMKPDLPVQNLVKDILEDAHVCVQSLHWSEATKSSRMSRALNSQTTQEKQWKINADKHKSLRPARLIIENLHESRWLYEQHVDARHLAILDCPPLPYAHQEEDLEQIIEMFPVHAETMKSVNRAFMSLVAREYWLRLGSGDFAGAVGDAEMLLKTTSLSMKHAGSHICDLKYLLKALELSHVGAGVDSDYLKDMIASEERIEKKRSSFFDRARESLGSPEGGMWMSAGGTAHSVQTSFTDFVNSILFNKIMTSLLVLNAVFILIEQTQRDDDSTNYVWLVMEVTFTVIFTIELVVKLYALRCHYVNDNWNLFDFVMVGLSYFGLAMELLVYGQDDSMQGADVSQEARIFRLNRVFRVLRILRLVRLMRFVRGLAAKLAAQDASLRLGEHMRTITVFRAFVQAHVESQIKLTQLFGEKGKITTCEEARCILESQAEVYKALHVSAVESDGLEGTAVLALRVLRDIIQAVRKMVDFVMGAQHCGVLTNREAEMLVEPLQTQIMSFDAQIHQLMCGNVRSVEEVGNGVPLNFEEYLNDYVVNHETAKRRISEALSEECRFSAMRSSLNSSNYDLLESARMQTSSRRGSKRACGSILNMDDNMMTRKLTDRSSDDMMRRLTEHSEDMMRKLTGHSSASAESQGRADQPSSLLVPPMGLSRPTSNLSSIRSNGSSPAEEGFPTYLSENGFPTYPAYLSEGQYSSGFQGQYSSKSEIAAKAEIAGKASPRQQITSVSVPMDVVGACRSPKSQESRSGSMQSEKEEADTVSSPEIQDVPEVHRKLTTKTVSREGVFTFDDDDSIEELATNIPLPPLPGSISLPPLS